MDTVNNTPLKDIKHRQRMEIEFRKDLDKVLSIFCCSEHKDNYNLWTNFAANHTGFCVGFDTRIMLKGSEILGSGGKVDYYPLNRAPKRKPICLSDDERILEMQKVIFSLPDKYSDEDEYRLTKLHLRNRKVVINPKAIKEVIIGYKMSAKNRNEIVNITKSRFPDAKLLVAKYDNDREKYSFHEI